MIETSDKVAFLKKIHLFYGMEDDELTAIAEELEEKSFAEGSVIFQQGDQADSFFLIYRGGVRIMRKQDGKDIQLALLVKNDYFGEMALVAKRKRSGTVTATSDSLVLVLSRADFEKLYKQTSQLRLNLDVALRSRQLARSLQFKWLQKDEVIYFLARKHPILLYQKLPGPIFALAVPLFLFYSWYTIAHFFIVVFAASLSLIAVILWTIWLSIDWGNDYYIVTNQRVVWLEKVIGIYDSRQESPLNMILSVSVETDQLGRILDYGDVIIRTYVGRIPFHHVNHPEQAQHMIEEYWNRTREHAMGTEKEAMKNALRTKLGLPIPPKPKPASDKQAAPEPKQKSAGAILGLLSANRLKLRYELGENVIYRKHWVVLILESWIPFFSTLGVLLLLLYRIVVLAFDPAQALISFQNGGFHSDTMATMWFLLLFPLGGWLAYEIVDWSNDKFEVTPEQIIDIDRKPFSRESRNAAQLESILGTHYERRGIIGNLFNFGTVYITVGGDHLAFEDVIDPATVQSDIDRRRAARIEKKRQAEVAAERERMAEWLATYHHNAEEFRREEEKKKEQKSE